MKALRILIIGTGLAYIIQHTVIACYYSESIEKAWEIYLRGAISGFWIGVFCLRAFQWWVDRVERSEEE